MYYCLIIKNNGDGKSHIEFTETKPEERLKLHQSREVKETENFNSPEIAYYEAHKSKEEAIHRTNSLKLYGNAWAQLKRRIKESLR